MEFSETERIQILEIAGRELAIQVREQSGNYVYNVQREAARDLISRIVKEEDRWPHAVKAVKAELIEDLRIQGQEYRKRISEYVLNLHADEFNEIFEKEYRRAIRGIIADMIKTRFADRLETVLDSLVSLRE